MSLRQHANDALRADAPFFALELRRLIARVEWIQRAQLTKLQQLVKFQQQLGLQLKQRQLWRQRSQFIGQ